jgi:hypothetical protein
VEDSSPKLEVKSESMNPSLEEISGLEAAAFSSWPALEGEEDYLRLSNHLVVGTRRLGPNSQKLNFR